MNVVLSNLAREHQLKEDTKHNVVTGTQNGYTFVLSERENKEIAVLFSVKSNYDRKEELTSALKEVQNKIPELIFYTYAGTKVKINLNIKKAQDSEKLYQVIQEVSQSLQSLDFQNCCQLCEMQGTVLPASIKGEAGIFCDNCFNRELQNAQNTSGNVGLGIIGAFLGSLIGVIIWILIYQFNIIAGIAGYFMFYFAFKGYQLLGKKKDKKGVIISLLISIVMLLVAEGLGITIAFIREFNVSFSEAVQLINVVMQDSEGLMAIIRDVILGYVLMIAASYSSIKQTFKESKNSYDTVRL